LNSHDSRLAIAFTIFTSIIKAFAAAELQGRQPGQATEKLYMKYLLLFPTLFWLLTSVGCAYLQTKKGIYDLPRLLADGQLEVFNRKVASSKEGNNRAIVLSEVPGDGVVWLKNVTFENGTIELDIKGKDVLQQSFVGVAFHGKDEKILDAVYFRPFNFRAADSVRRIHAVQFVSHPLYTWEKLRQEKNGLYEKAVFPTPNANEWFHAKIVVHYPIVNVYVNGSQKPSLTVEQLSERKAGKIGLWVGNNSGGSFANLKITHQ
jgi:hypothetical protein